MRGSAHRTEEIEEFMRTVSPSLFRAALLVCGDHHLAEDLVQTTLGKVFVSWRRVRKADHPPAYVRAMLMRTYLSYVRLHRTYEKPVGELPEQVSGARDPALRLTLMNALAQLPPRDRAVVVLRYWEDRSVAQTAAELGLSEGNVRIRSMRALKILRGTLAGQHDILTGK
ncbi:MULTISPECIES: SigE family RNA polymerase sigma factor [unclassified Streptomyces]|uniref:SigE family RNA polymerase sigma factor n=1 Tax=unclassified Streptomyces TaxID=2593676 RepID=UPI002E180D0B